MTIPEVREALWLLAHSKGCPPAIREGILELIPEMYRRKPKCNARASAKPITAAVKKMVREFREEHPDMPLRDIGRRFGIDGGRVSEILHGFRS